MSAVLTPGTLAPTTPPPADLGPKRWKWTREQYYRLSDLGFFRGKRVERIRGELIEMSAINWSHELGKIKSGDVLTAAFAGTGWVHRNGPMPVEESDPEPDVAVYPGRPADYADHPTNPLLVVEVASTSLTYDTTTKVELYAEAGHPEYWVLDVDNRLLLVFRDPLSIPAGGHTYRTWLTLAPTDSVSPLAAPAATIRVADLLP
jgi:Uma2 family endonuclease